PLFAGVILLWDYRSQLFVGLPACDPGTSDCRSAAGATALQVFVVLALVILGWALARDFVRGLEPLLFKRLDTAATGTAGFVIRLLAMVGAVVFGLAAQQTLGNLIAGIVLLSARPFRVGDRVRLQGGGLAGRIEGVVSA